jgi:hypothetical protein
MIYGTSQKEQGAPCRGIEMDGLDFSVQRQQQLSITYCFQEYLSIIIVASSGNKDGYDTGDHSCLILIDDYLPKIPLSHAE